MTKNLPAPPWLLVEDSQEDYETTLRALRRVGAEVTVRRCATGDEALEYLRRGGKYAADGVAPRPGLIVFDLNLPGTDGRDVLAEIKADPDLRVIPVVVLSTSGDDRDVAACYRAGASSYIQKPMGLEAFYEAVRRLCEYWLEAVTLPPCV
jgi:CheY-like chemotaxis protein